MTIHTLIEGIFYAVVFFAGWVSCFVFMDWRKMKTSIEPPYLPVGPDGHGQKFADRRAKERVPTSPKFGMHSPLPLPPYTFIPKGENLETHEEFLERWQKIIHEANRKQLHNLNRYYATLSAKDRDNGEVGKAIAGSIRKLREELKQLDEEYTKLKQSKP